MRELKFRAWDKKQKKMLYGVSIGTIKIWDENTPLLSHEFSYSEDCIFEQYTGLKDKNGKEIYEGDIVKVEKRFDAIAVGYDAGGFVLHNEDWDCVIPMNRGEYDGLGIGLGDKCTTVEVIGNIHENKELLKGEE